MVKIMKFCLLALALTPFIVDKFAFLPFNTGENLFTRGLLFLVSIFFLINFFSIQKFRNQIVEKIKLIIKNPIVISILAFILIFVVSTIFAVNKYNAFWGTIERTEGLVGMIYLLSFFVFSLLIFEKKDWLWFFKLNLVASFILLFKEFIQFFGGNMRPSSFLDNPTFLAGYLLFSIFCSIFVFSEDKIKFWKYFSVITLILSILGVFITQTRGTILGLVVGFIFVLIYGIIKGKNIFYKKLNLRKYSTIILCLIFSFSILFFVTRNNEIWQKVPGLGRVAMISSSDSTTQTRLLMAKLSIEAVNPIQNGWKKFVIGWGPENFSLAYGQYFNPAQFSYEMGWFDRSHNKLFDILVMNGLFGLIAYLAIWFFFFKAIFKKRGYSLLNIGLLFLGVSLLVHLLFVFDQIMTSIPFFAVLSFIVYFTIYENTNKQIEKNKQNHEINKTNLFFVSVFFLILTSFLCFIFLKSDIQAYFQMKNYISLKDKGNTKIMLNQINSVFEPFTPAQMNIRNDFLSFAEKNYNKNDESMVALSNIAILRAEEYVKKNPFDLRFLAYIASAYSTKGNNLKNKELLIKGEEAFTKLLIYTPNRPDFIYGLALNLFFQDKYEESFVYFEKAFNLSPSYFIFQGKKIEGTYIVFLQNFYQAKDKENFIKVANRLIINNYSDGANLTKIIEYIEKTNTWPRIDFGA